MDKWYGKPIKKALSILHAKNKCLGKTMLYSNIEDSLMIFTQRCAKGGRLEINQFYMWVIKYLDSYQSTVTFELSEQLIRKNLAYAEKEKPYSIISSLLSMCSNTHRHVWDTDDCIPGLREVHSISVPSALPCSFNHSFL